MNDPTEGLARLLSTQDQFHEMAVEWLEEFEDLTRHASSIVIAMDLIWHSTQTIKGDEDRDVVGCTGNSAIWLLIRATLVSTYWGRQAKPRDPAPS